MTSRIFRTILAVVLLVLVLCMGLTTWILYTSFEDNLVTELKSELAYISQGILLGGTDYLSALPASSSRRPFCRLRQGNIILS